MRREERGSVSDAPSASDVPADLVVTVLLTIATGVAVLVPVVAETPLRIVLGLPFLLFLPGYALVSALFPRAKSPEVSDDPDASDVTYVGGKIGGFERVALSVGSSVAVVALVGYFLDFTPWEIRLAPVVAGVTAFTLVMAAVAAVRRVQTPEQVRFSVPFRAWSERALAGLAPETRRDAVLNVLVVLSLTLALGSVAYAVTSPNQDSFTQFYVMASNESGEPVTHGYPQNLTVGENETLYVGIDNHEHQQVEYTVVVLLQRVSNETDSAQEVERLGQFRVSLESNRTKLTKNSFAPSTQGDQLRLTYLLYRGEPPANPTRANAYRVAYFPVNVSEP